MTITIDVDLIDLLEESTKDITLSDNNNNNNKSSSFSRRFIFRNFLDRIRERMRQRIDRISKNRVIKNKSKRSAEQETEQDENSSMQMLEAIANNSDINDSLDIDG